MTTRLAERGRPGGLLRWFLRAPIVFYRAGLGWLFGRRLLMLVHTGRRSGAARRTVVEVVDHEPRSGTYFIASGWGEKSDWLQNVTKTPRVTVYVGARRFEADAVRLAVDDATRALSAYAGRHPKAFSRLGNVMLGRRLRPTPEDCRSLAESVPLVALKPSDV